MFIMVLPTPVTAFMSVGAKAVWFRCTAAGIRHHLFFAGSGFNTGIMDIGSHHDDRGECDRIGTNEHQTPVGVFKYCPCRLYGNGICVVWKKQRGWEQHFWYVVLPGGI